jgi:hypothetical protein
MTADPVAFDWEGFLRSFFGTGNDAWPDQDRNSAAGLQLAPLIASLMTRNAPGVLPRRQNGRLTVYVIPWSQDDFPVVSEALTAFIGPSFSDFDGRPCRLQENDPVEAALQLLVPEGSVFRLPREGDLDAAGWRAVKLFHSVLDSRPNLVQLPPRSLGRLLAEFDVALASGEATASMEVLEMLATLGGLTAANLGHLRIKRLGKLGRDSELLRTSTLTDILIARPPLAVVEAVLIAEYNVLLHAALEERDLPSAQLAKREGHRVLYLLAPHQLADVDGPALIALGLEALEHQDSHWANLILESRNWCTQAGDLPGLSEALHELGGVSNPVESALVSAEPTDAPTSASVSAPNLPCSWTDWAERCLHRDATRLDDDVWRQWTPPVQEDLSLATTLQGLSDVGAARAWVLAGPFIDADQYGEPAKLSAAAFIYNALTYDRFTPSDLAGLAALLEIALRGAPDAHGYAQLLDDITSESSRWVSCERAEVALDVVDIVLRAACPDREAQLRLVSRLLSPLAMHATRLNDVTRRFAGSLSVEAGVGLEWPSPDADESEPVAYAAGNILLYSLDEGVLHRVTEALAASPHQVRSSHAYVGGDQLRQHARTADVIVLATRCAKHAATGFIRSHARPDAAIVEADGSGSASMLRAVDLALQRRAGG